MTLVGSDDGSEMDADATWDDEHSSCVPVHVRSRGEALPLSPLLSDCATRRKSHADGDLRVLEISVSQVGRNSCEVVFVQLVSGHFAVLLVLG